MAYPTYTDLKAWLGIAVGVTGEDTQLDIIMDGVVKYVEQATNRVWVAVSATRTFPISRPWIDESRRVLTFFEDLCTVSSVTNGDGVVVAVTEYDLVGFGAPYYQLRLRRESAKIFTSSSVGAGVAIAGTWGASVDVPDDIKELIIELGAYRYRMKQNANAGATITVTKGGTIAQAGDTPQYIKDALNLRRRRST